MSYSTVDIPDWEWDTSNPFTPAFPTVSPALSPPSPVITTPASMSLPVPITPPDVVPSSVPAIAPGTVAYPGHSPASHLLRDSRRPTGSAMPGVCAWHVRLSIPPGGVRR